MGLQDLTKSSVEAAMEEYDELGRDSFLKKYGFGRARKFAIVHNGRAYDSKAIAGAAHRSATGRSMPANEFNGGIQTVRPLQALGFDVRDTSIQDVSEIYRLLGEVEGVSPGQEFANRQQVREAGVHRALQAGIVGTRETGAESVVVSGGYVDDDDLGGEIVYTGHGGRDSSGRQVADQSFAAPGNGALQSSGISGAPVRVIRGAHRGSAYAPSSGYRYDGLFTVEDVWRERGRDGYLICRYRLVDSAVARARPSARSNEIKDGVPGGSETPGRKTGSASRVVRSLAVAEYVKALYGNRCQACRTVLDLGGRSYSEAAHIQAVGRPHNGPDTVSNLLCLCPNCHVLFDAGALLVDHLTFGLTLNGLPIGRLLVDERHALDGTFFAYHQSVHL